MNRGLVATAKVKINSSTDKVWQALTDPDIIKKYMFGTDVVTDWIEGSPIFWKGIWEGKPYEDKGVILNVVPHKTLKVSHYSPLSGIPDIQDNYHILTYTVLADGKSTVVELSQDNNPDEKSRDHSQRNWEMMLLNLKKTVEE